MKAVELEVETGCGQGLAQQGHGVQELARIESGVELAGGASVGDQVGDNRLEALGNNVVLQARESGVPGLECLGQSTFGANEIDVLTDPLAQSVVGRALAAHRRGRRLSR